MLSFVYVTCRKEPKFEWFVDSLYNECLINNYNTNNIEIILVDFDLQYDKNRKEKFSIIVNQKFKLVHVCPKPSAVQGLYKVTKNNYFSASNARNTGVCYANYDYIVFVDDTSVMQVGSLKHIIEYSKQKIVVAFSYKKVVQLEIKQGNILSSVDKSIDCRWDQGSDFRQIDGGQFYGYSASPLEIVLNVNGYDEICDTIGMEDVQYGLRLNKLNVKIYYTKNVLFLESEDFANQENKFLRIDTILNQNKYNELLKLYNVPKRRNVNGKTDVSNFILDLLERPKSWTEGNNYNLKELRTHIQLGNTFIIDTFDKNTTTLHGIKLCDL